MLTALRLGNFKAFAETQRIPIRPLTLIFGANSSGKSSLIHGLLLAKEAVEGREPTLDVYRTEAGGDSVDLGGFRQYIHRREVGRRIEWAAEISVASLKGRLAERLASVNKAMVSVTIGLELDNEGDPVPGAQPAVDSYELEADGVSLLRMSRRRDGALRLDRLGHDHPVFRDVLKAIVETATTTESLKQSDLEDLGEVIAELVPEITASAERLLPRSVLRAEEPVSDIGHMALFPVSRGRRKEDLADAVRFFLPRMLDEIIKGLSDAVTSELSRLRYLGPLRSYPPRHLAFAQYHDPNWFAGGGYAWDVVRRNERVRKAVNEWLGSAERLQTPYEMVVRELVGIDQLESPSQREYILEGESVSEEQQLWAAPKSPPVLRVAQEMAARVAPLLRVAETILFIDPHFGPQHIRYRRPLEAFLLAILEQRYEKLPIRIEMHTGDELGADFFRDECRRCLPNIIPVGISVRFIRWKQKVAGEKLHNRFILTDKGGVIFGVGLDDGDGADGETDDVKLLDNETYKFRWAQYQRDMGSETAFDLVDELVIEGEASPQAGRTL